MLMEVAVLDRIYERRYDIWGGIHMFVRPFNLRVIEVAADEEMSVITLYSFGDWSTYARRVLDSAFIVFCGTSVQATAQKAVLVP